MKLLDKYNRISILVTILVIVVTGFVYYFTISYILTNQVDKDLAVEENEIFDYVKFNHRLPQVFKSADLKIHFQPIGQNTVPRKFKNTPYWDERDREEESGRELLSWVKVNETNYSITIIESKVETEDLIRMIFFITLGIVLLLIIVIVTVNRLLIRNLWRPFYEILGQIKLFNLTDQNSIKNLKTAIVEFQDMNHEISAMTVRVRHDYLELKDFVENAAHELMTPIAVMNSKLDTLIQSSNLTERQGVLINDMYGTMTKLTRLNKAMLLLTKIENKLINDQEYLDLKKAIESTCSEFQDMATDRDLVLKINLTDVWITISHTLLDILLANLIGNAIRHNKTGGEISITLTNEALIIKNTGKYGALDEHAIFQRFYRSPESEGSGLGLTQAWQICQNCGFKLQYSYDEVWHVFTIILKTAV